MEKQEPNFESPFVADLVFCPKHNDHSSVIDVNECQQCYAPGSRKDQSRHSTPSPIVDPDTVPDLYRLAYMPGEFRCPQCGFQLSKQTISVVQCAIGTTAENRQSEPCPNDGTMMVHVTYREQLEVCAERLKEEFDRFAEHTKAISQFLNDMYATMIDPVEQPKMTVAEMRELLLKTAREQREAEHHRQGAGSPTPSK